MLDRWRSGRLSPLLQRQRFRAALPHLGGSVLDVGCNRGSLADHVSAGDYLGVDINGEALTAARGRHRAHRFLAEVPAGEQFDTVAALAVIEHVPDQTSFLSGLRQYLRPGGRIVLTTPHPRAEWLHDLGVKLRLFSALASEDHEQLLDRRAITECAREAGLVCLHFHRFLGGANQLIVLARREEVHSSDAHEDTRA